jgi:hypothetical protein
LRVIVHDQNSPGTHEFVFQPAAKNFVGIAAAILPLFATYALPGLTSSGNGTSQGILISSK